MRRFTALLLVLCWMAGLAPAVQAVDIGASSAVLMDAASGRVLYGRRQHDRRPIASITKLMTGLVAVESGHALEELVTVAPEWAGAEGSSIYLRAGEVVTLETLLYGMLLRSGNDAALAVAGHCGGSVEDFVERMNDKADELGMSDSRFLDPNGLSDEGHFSTAYDMALLARSCLDHPVLAEILATRSIALGDRSFTNHNKLLWRYEGCIGLKTGYTERAGRTLVSAARRDGMTLICVTLNDPDDWQDHARLLDYGFSRYHMEELAQAGAPLGQLPVLDSLVPACPVEPRSSLAVAVCQEERPSVKVELTHSALRAPVAAGSKVGEVVCILDGRILARTDLIAGASIACDRTEAGPLSQWIGRWIGQL